MIVLRFLICVVFLAASLLAQTDVATPLTSSQPNSTPGVPQKDPQALQLLARMMAATHWSQSVQDAVATGTMSNASDPAAPQRRFTLNMRGRNDYRLDNADGSASTILSGLSGAIVRGDKVVALPVHVASDRGFMLPMLSLLADYGRADIEISNGDVGSVNGIACTDVKLARVFNDNSAVSKVRSRITDAIVCISGEGLPLRVRHTRASLDNQTALFEETIVYSDYRGVNGVLVPFRQQVFIDREPTTSIQFETVEINVGPPDNLFRIPAMPDAGGAR